MWKSILCTGAVLIAITMAGRAGPAVRVFQVPTYTKDIAPLLSEHCAMCHVADGPGPFSLLTYEEAKRHKTEIAAVTRTRHMPPWKADPDDGPFVGQHPLTDAEIDRIQQWAAAGAPEGDTGVADGDGLEATPPREANG